MLTASMVTRVGVLCLPSEQETESTVVDLERRLAVALSDRAQDAISASVETDRLKSRVRYAEEDRAVLETRLREAREQLAVSNETVADLQVNARTCTQRDSFCMVGSMSSLTLMRIRRPRLCTCRTPQLTMSPKSRPPFTS